MGKKTKTRTQYDENGNAILNQNGNKVRKQERFADFDFKEVRNHWELKLNQYSEREQSLRRYDSRSFEAQGLDKIAEIPLTREEYRLEKNEQKRCEKEGIEYKPVTYYGQKMNRLEDIIVAKYHKYLVIRRKNKHKMKLDYLSKTLTIK